jgi:diguanylate cyclase (GGDEF)-like protein
MSSLSATKPALGAESILMEGEYRRLFAVMIAIVILSYGSLRLAHNLGMVATIWPADGVILAALLATRPGAWPAYLLTAGIANLASTYLAGFPIASCVRIPLTNFIEMSLALSALRRILGQTFDLSEPGVLWRFAFIAGVLSPITSAILNALLLVTTENHPNPWRFAATFFAHSLGIIMVTPFVLAVFRGEFRSIFTRHRLARSTLALALLFGVTTLVFVQSRYPLLFLVYPPLVLTVVELGFSGGTLALLFSTFIAIGFTVSGHGPITLVHDASVAERVAIAQLFLSVAAILVLALSAILAERNRAMEQLERAKEQLAGLATTDTLTGLANRRKFDAALDLEFRRAASNHTPVSLLLLDVDCFKAFNDLYGHLAGDECLRAVADVLASFGRRAGDLAARYGGEEFAVLLVPADSEAAATQAEALRAAVQALRLAHAGNREAGGSVTVSIGVATIKPNKFDIDPKKLIARADAGLYAAKNAGRNRVEVSV